MDGTRCLISKTCLRVIVYAFDSDTLNLHFREYNIPFGITDRGDYLGLWMVHEL